VDFRSNPFKGLHLYAFEISIWLQGIVHLLRAPKVHPMSVAPSFEWTLEVIHSKVFIFMLLKSFSE
jgi:hypothetical protein